MRIALATTNQGKIAEIKAVLGDADIEWVTAGPGSGWPKVEETGATFFDNATAKAKALAEHLNMPALADDSGLEVEALGGRPGIHSARYAGPRAADADNVAKLLGELSDVPAAGRGARFVAVVVLARPDGSQVSATGTCPGAITDGPRGHGGFGYDPVFLPDGYEKTMAELTPEEKNSLSHRGRALRALKVELDRLAGSANEAGGKAG